jgi:hypothetical protein
MVRIDVIVVMVMAIVVMVVVDGRKGSCKRWEKTKYLYTRDRALESIAVHKYSHHNYR